MLRVRLVQRFQQCNVSWTGARFYVAKNDDFKGKRKDNTLFDALRKKKKKGASYLEEDSFPRSRTELKPLTKDVDIDKVYKLTDDNPFASAIEDVDRIMEVDVPLDKKKDLVDVPELKDEVIRQAILSARSRKEKKAGGKSVEQQNLDRMAGSAQELTRKQLQRKLDEKIPEKKLVQEMPIFTLEDVPMERMVAAKTTSDFSPDVMQQVARSRYNNQKVKDIAIPLKGILESRALEDNASYHDQLVDRLENGEKTYTQVPEDLHIKKNITYTYAKEEELTMKQKIDDFDVRTKHSDKFIFGIKDDVDENNGFNDKSKEETKKDKENQEILGRAVKEGENKRADSEQERFEGEDSDAPHSAIIIDVPLTVIEKEQIEERKKLKEEREERIRVEQAYGERGDSYITDIEEVNSDEETFRHAKLTEAKERMDEKLIEHSIENSEKKASVDIVDGNVLVDGVTVPTVSKQFIDELYGRMPRRERKRIEKRLANEEIRLRRSKLKHTQAKKYIYDGDSQFTRRQLRVAEMVKMYLERTLQLPQFRRDLERYAIVVEHITINRDLSVATIFWTTPEEDVQSAYDILVKVKPQIRKFFAKQTSSMKISPDMVFIKRDFVEQNKDRDIFLDDLRHSRTEIQKGSYSAEFDRNRTQFMNEPLSPEMKEAYGVKEPKYDPATLHGGILADFEEDRIKSKIYDEHVRMDRDRGLDATLTKEMFQGAGITKEDIANELAPEAEPYANFSPQHEKMARVPKMEQQKEWNAMLDKKEESDDDDMEEYIPREVVGSGDEARAIAFPDRAALEREFLVEETKYAKAKRNDRKAFPTFTPEEDYREIPPPMSDEYDSE